MKQAALRGNPPTRRSVFQSADLVKRFRAFPAQLAALEAARPRPRTRNGTKSKTLSASSLSQANSGAMHRLKRRCGRRTARSPRSSSGVNDASPQNSCAGLLWVAPALLVLVTLSIYPLLYLMKVSLTDAHGFTLAHLRAPVPGSFVRRRSRRRLLLYAAAALTLEFFLGLALALLVDSLARGRALFRVGLLAPMLLPPVVAAVIWRLIYNPQFGVLNGMLRQLGFNTANLTWTSGRSSRACSP